MLSKKTNFFNVFHRYFSIIKIELYFNDCFFYYVDKFLIKFILHLIKYHFRYCFKILTFISTVDLQNHKNRFKIIYDFLSLKFNNRIKIKIITNELSPIFSIKSLYINSVWWELECWDMFGVIFFYQKNVTKLLTDYGFQGFPLRKDFPLSGFIDSKYNLNINKIVYDDIELSQSFRNFFFTSPWLFLKKI